MLLKPRQLLEPEEWWRMIWPWKNNSNYKRWRSIIRCLPNKKEIERLSGGKIKKKWIRKKFIELIWVTSWLRMRLPPLLNWLLIDLSHTTLRASPKLSKRTLWSKEKIKLLRQKPWRRTTRLRSINGQFRIWPTLSISSITRLNWQTKKRSWLKNTETSIS